MSHHLNWRGAAEQLRASSIGVAKALKPVIACALWWSQQLSNLAPESPYSVVSYPAVQSCQAGHFGFLSYMGKELNSYEMASWNWPGISCNGQKISWLGVELNTSTLCIWELSGDGQLHEGRKKERTRKGWHMSGFWKCLLSALANGNTKVKGARSRGERVALVALVPW